MKQFLRSALEAAMLLTLLVVVYAWGVFLLRDVVDVQGKTHMIERTFDSVVEKIADSEEKPRYRFVFEGKVCYGEDRCFEDRTTVPLSKEECNAIRLAYIAHAAVLEARYGKRTYGSFWCTAPEQKDPNPYETRPA